MSLFRPHLWLVTTQFVIPSLNYPFMCIKLRVKKRRKFTKLEHVSSGLIVVYLEEFNILPLCSVISNSLLRNDYNKSSFLTSCADGTNIKFQFFNSIIIDSSMTTFLIGMKIFWKSISLEFHIVNECELNWRHAFCSQNSVSFSKLHF